MKDLELRHPKKRDLVLLNISALLLCLILFFCCLFASAQVGTKIKHEKITAKILNMYQRENNKNALKSLLISHKNTKEMIIIGLSVGKYFCIALVMIFICNLYLSSRE